MAGGNVGPPHEHILEEEVRDELVLYDQEQELFVSLNSSASDVWRLATGELSADEIVERLAVAYGSDPEAIRSDVESTIGDLVDKELIPPLTS